MAARWFDHLRAPGLNARLPGLGEANSAFGRSTGSGPDISRVLASVAGDVVEQGLPDIRHRAPTTTTLTGCDRLVSAAHALVAHATTIVFGDQDTSS